MFRMSTIGVRDIKIDIIRCLACMMVILMHTPRPEGGLPAPFHASLALLTEPCIGLFFMVSGALLLPVKMSYVEFIKRRIKKILSPILIFSLFYLMILYTDGNIDMVGLCRGVLSIPFGAQGCEALWFLDIIVSLYFVAPLISPFLESATKKELQLILLMWMVTLCSPWIYIIIGTHTRFLGTFSGYTGYFVLGYYLKRYPIKMSFCWFAVLIAVPQAAYIFCKYIELPVSMYSHFWYLSLFSLMQCVAWYSIVNELEVRCVMGVNGKLHRLITDFACCSLGVYLVHIFIMRRFVWNIEWIQNMSPILQFISIFTMTVLLSWGFSHLLSYTPLGKYVVGYSRSNSTS